jgi:transketolase
MRDMPVKDTVEFSKSIRLETLKMVYNAKASHIGGAFSMADILAVLYGKLLKVDALNPFWDERDRFLLSKGHACTSLYATLALINFFDLKLLSTYTANNSILLAHTSHKIPGIEFSAGSLGHALSVCCGIALAGKKEKKNWKVVALLSDGELDEGSNWEAILFAPQHSLSNLILIIDYNKIQSLGSVSEVLDLEPLPDKFSSFGWNVISIDGHNHEEIEKAYIQASSNSPNPTVIIANTIKGKGVDFMEDKLLWHYKSPSEEQYLSAKSQLEK